MKSVLLAALVTLCSAAGAFADTMHVSIEAGLMVFDRRAAAESLGNWADNNGGYFTFVSDEYVVLRVPDDKAESFRSYAEGISDSIISYGRSTVDLRQEILRLSASVEANEEILGRNLELLDVSDVEGTLALEQEVRRLMNEIDAAKGKLRKINNDAAMALISVSLSFRSQTLADHRPSNFDWINRVDFYNFVSGWSRADGKKPGSGNIVPPQGFAPVDSRRSWEAISPEGLRLRILRVKNYPEQNQDFWTTALERDLRERGYLPVAQNSAIIDFEAGDDFATSLWGMPVGELDYLYLIGIRVDGKKLDILEFAGPAEYVREYLED